jgi:hypothetical protein
MDYDEVAEQVEGDIARMRRSAVSMRTAWSSDPDFDASKVAEQLNQAADFIQRALDRYRSGEDDGKRLTLYAKGRIVDMSDQPTIVFEYNGNLPQPSAESVAKITKAVAEWSDGVWEARNPKVGVVELWVGSAHADSLAAGDAIRRDQRFEKGFEVLRREEIAED